MKCQIPFSRNNETICMKSQILFFRKQRDSLHEVSDPFFLGNKETICMKCQIFFSRKNKKHVISFSSAELQSTLVISNSKGLFEILRDIRTSTYQICRVQEKIIR